MLHCNVLMYIEYCAVLDVLYFTLKYSTALFVLYCTAHCTVMSVTVHLFAVEMSTELTSSPSVSPSSSVVRV